tara:strand:- start:127 stop:351 length:225 start_codon:yes stop_codon:yes gene_type:complete
MIVIAFMIGYIDDITGPQEHYYKDTIVVVDKKYQCPNYCKVHHYHSVYFEGNGMVIEESDLGEKVKKKKKSRKK